jgi:hypothetical protein
MNSNSSFKKIVGATMLVAVLSVAGIVVPKKAHAQVSFDVAARADIGVKSFDESAVKYAHTGKSYFGIPVPYTSLDSIMKLAVKQILDAMQQQVLAWTISGRGINGQPFFEVNLGLYINETRETTGRNAIEDVKNNTGGICNYFKSDVVIALSDHFQIPDFNDSKPSTCKTEQTIGKDKMAIFLAGNFDEGGGWDSWGAISQDINSTPMGAYLLEQDRISSTINSKESLEREKLASQGQYHAQEDANGNVVTPANVIRAQAEISISTNFRQLELAHSFDDVVTVLAQSLVSKVMSTSLIASIPRASFSANASFTIGGSASVGASASGGTSVSTNGQYVRLMVPHDEGLTTANQSGQAGDDLSAENIAPAGRATQSSTYINEDEAPHDASVALTGSNNRSPRTGLSITRTNDKPWWQVDLRGVHPIELVRIVPRQDDGDGSDLTNFSVIVSDATGAEVWRSPAYKPTKPRDVITEVKVPRGTTGRFVRIERNDTGRLEIAGVEVYANDAPILSLIGAKQITISRGMFYQDPGAVAYDKHEGDISDSIVVTGTVNMFIPGTYTLTYSVENSQGVSSGTLTRTVIVQ